MKKTMNSELITKLKDRDIKYNKKLNAEIITLRKEIQNKNKNF